MKKQYEQKVWYYTHFIDEYNAGTVHLNALESFAYLTLIWEAHSKRGHITVESLDALYRRNKHKFESEEVMQSIYDRVLDEFWDFDETYFTNKKVTSDMQVTKLHKEKSEKGANTTNLKKMVDSDKRLDELRQLNKMMPSKHNKRIADVEGLVKYCKKLQEDKRFTFERIKQIIKSYDGHADNFYPALDVIFNDTKAKFWKVAQEPSSEDKLEYVSRATKWLTENSYNWSNLEERNNLIKQHYKEEVR
jgi:uncharacterized protein YdaU (DUF1376 family)